MTSVDDYKSKLWIQLTEIRFPREAPKYFLKSWNDVAEELRKIDSFGGQLTNRSELKSAADNLVAGEEEPVEKMKAVYRFASESMVWNGNHNILVKRDIDRGNQKRE